MPRIGQRRHFDHPVVDVAQQFFMRIGQFPQQSGRDVAVSIAVDRFGREFRRREIGPHRRERNRFPRAQARLQVIDVALADPFEIPLRRFAGLGTELFDRHGLAFFIGPDHVDVAGGAVEEKGDFGQLAPLDLGVGRTHPVGRDEALGADGHAVHGMIVQQHFA
ncbi:hypothetical protein SDC9_121850 [bioreactor metagenome]|uniref:Uncharacterized protein n=1 Tax=bioreactor metagenome TaxID=1076179 RepID=A0A645CD73_9ZZZZ